MFGKPPVTALQEYCAKSQRTLPLYQCINADDGTNSFVCSVEALGETCFGNGRSKKEAKHDAAANLIKEIVVTHPDIMLIPQAPHEVIPITDAIIALRDICVKENHPLPIFDIVQQAGPAEAPEFTVLCQLASIKRYGVANTKKAAKQRAAVEMLRIIQTAPKNDDKLELTSIDAEIEEVEEERYRKLKTYRELTESGSADKSGELISDRHYFFEKFHDNLKAEAKRILNEGGYLSNKEHVGDLLRALKIKPIVKTLPSKSLKPLFFIDLNLEFDVVFFGDEEIIYPEILQYFKDML